MRGAWGKTATLGRSLEAGRGEGVGRLALTPWGPPRWTSGRCQRSGSTCERNEGDRARRRVRQCHHNTAFDRRPSSRGLRRRAGYGTTAPRQQRATRRRPVTALSPGPASAVAHPHSATRHDEEHDRRRRQHRPPAWRMPHQTQKRSTAHVQHSDRPEHPRLVRWREGGGHDGRSFQQHRREPSSGRMRVDLDVRLGRPCGR